MARAARRAIRDTVTPNSSTRAADDLIARYVEEDPSGMGRHRARVVVGEAGVPVWVLVGYLCHGWTIAEAADDYALHEDAVAAALAYHDRYPDATDAFLALNAQPLDPDA